MGGKGGPSAAESTRCGQYLQKQSTQHKNTGSGTCKAVGCSQRTVPRAGTKAPPLESQGSLRPLATTRVQCRIHPRQGERTPDGAGPDNPRTHISHLLDCEDGCPDLPRCPGPTKHERGSGGATAEEERREYFTSPRSGRRSVEGAPWPGQWVRNTAASGKERKK